MAKEESLVCGEEYKKQLTPQSVILIGWQTNNVCSHNGMRIALTRLCLVKLQQQHLAVPSTALDVGLER